MKHKKNKTPDLVKVSKASLISMVASQIKGKILFPKKMEEAKKMLDHARLVKK
ncbi:hypothetical protein [Longitalea arenae]|uniref:hypothetical protein n=1 Tax=Longitalea arenae TaxID=2812558 RepID=UPI00196802BA|nr:hypothetical protein [Longitalea arenae]